jgi:HKD family nuclease
MLLNIQDPTRPTSASLQETLIAASTHAIKGGGAFAFVTPGGIQLFLEDTSFTQFLLNGTFDLIVGTDEITNLRSIEKLNELNNSYANFSVSAFLHNLRGSTFHPKFSWFKKDDGRGVLIVGSGNLTIKGLRENWEAFSINQLTEQQIDEVEQFWNDWKTACAPYLKQVNSEEVRTRVEQNVIRRAPRRPVEMPETETGEEPVEEDENPAEPILEEEHPEDLIPWQINTENRVLVAEIPRGGSRWNQANFNQESFEDYFGGTRWDNSYRILLREVIDDGTLQPIENRQAVSVQSHNWRFELGAANGLEYPDEGRPIGIFIRVGVRMFLYTLIMPGSANYDDVNNFLNSTPWHGGAARLKRIQFSLQELRNHCPNLPFWSL